jgi:predicted metalloprotease with PDZ domain
MKRLYFEFSLQGKGITETDYKNTLEQISGISFDAFFKDFIHGTQPYESILTEALEYLGLELVHKPSSLYSEGRLGMKLIPLGKSFQVAAMYPGGPAELGGMRIGDEIIGVNGYVINNDIESWLSYFEDDLKEITFIREGRIQILLLPEVQRFFYNAYSLKKLSSINAVQSRSIKMWID